MKSFRDYVTMNEASFKVGDKVKEVEPMGQFRPGDTLEIVQIKSGCIGVIAKGQKPKDVLFDDPKNFKLVNEKDIEDEDELKESTNETIQTLNKGREGRSVLGLKGKEVKNSVYLGSGDAAVAKGKEVEIKIWDFDTNKYLTVNLTKDQIKWIAKL